MPWRWRSTWRPSPRCATARLSGISTGIHSLDSKMGGLQRSDLIVLAGRPGMGKTSLATNIAYNIAAAYEARGTADGSTKAKNGGVVGFYSLEMSSEQLATRIISEQTEVSSSKIRRGDINDADFEKLVACSHDDAEGAALYRPDRRYLHRPARRSRPPPASASAASTFWSSTTSS